MGLIGKVLAAKLGTRMMERALRRREMKAAAPAAGEYIPAAGANAARGGRLHALTDRATQVYRRNPKLLGGLATLAAAALLVGLKQKGRVHPHR